VKSPMPEDSSDSLHQPHRRLRRPQSPRSLLLALLCLLGIGGAWIGIGYLAIAYRRAMVPADAFLFSGSRLGNILAFVAPGFPSMVIGLIVGNTLVWCIPPARAALGGESSGAKGVRFRSTQFGLLKFAAAVSAIALPICFLGANNFWALTPERIDNRPLISSAANHYSWADVREIQTGCSKGKSTTYNFVVTLTDKTRIDLMEEKHQEFLAAYPQIQLALKGKNYTFSTWGLVGSCVASAPRRWLEILARRPTE
jgi:hypothetical protein